MVEYEICQHCKYYKDSEEDFSICTKFPYRDSALDIRGANDNSCICFKYRKEEKDEKNNGQRCRSKGYL